jgi:hypothetical protein
MGFYMLVPLYMIKYVIYSEAALSLLLSDRTVSLLVGQSAPSGTFKNMGGEILFPRRAWYNFYMQVVLLNASIAFLEHFS